MNMTDHRLAIQAILTMSKDSLIDGENTAASVAHAIAPDARHVPEPELRNYVASRMSEPVFAACLAFP
jgi:hypothetical protein